MSFIYEHIPVLFDEAIEGLNIKTEGIYVDGTIGGGGHALGIVKRLGPRGRLIGIDRDEEAIKRSREVLTDYKDRVSIVKDNYAHTKEVLKTFGINHIDGMLLDLGVSSHQFDDKERGFTYRFDAPLDMRMDQSQTLSAFDVVNNYTEERLCKVIHDYGEERFARNIARRICLERGKKPVETTFELSDIVKAAIPQKMRSLKGHPAKRTFQAIRIEVNGELDTLRDSIDKFIDILNPEGRLVIISFHSLEDRIVKRAFKNAEDPCICPKDLPLCVCGKKSKGRVLTKKPVKASLDELEKNPRSHSAKLRIFEKSG